MALTREQNRLLRTWMKDKVFFGMLDLEEQEHINKVYWNFKYDTKVVLSELNNIRKKYLLYLVQHKGYSWWDIDNMVKNGKDK